MWSTIHHYPRLIFYINVSFLKKPRRNLICKSSTSILFAISLQKTLIDFTIFVQAIEKRISNISISIDHRKSQINNCKKSKRRAYRSHGHLKQNNRLSLNGLW